MTDEEKKKYIMDFILTYFDSNEEKSSLWFYTPNPQLGGVEPIVMFNDTTKSTLSNKSKLDRLYKFILEAEEANT